MESTFGNSARKNSSKGSKKVFGQCPSMARERKHSVKTVFFSKSSPGQVEVCFKKHAQIFFAKGKKIYPKFPNSILKQLFSEYATFLSNGPRDK